MNSSRTNVAVLGASGSIGAAALDVIRQLGQPWRLAALSVHRQVEQLPSLASEFGCSLVVASDARQAHRLSNLQFSPQTRVVVGRQGLIEAATSSDIDTVLAAVVGVAGMESALAAAHAGKRLALANKEALVVAGGLLTRAIADSGGQLIPVDSEHSAIFQALRSGTNQEVARIILTASGGPFRCWTKSQIQNATVDDALEHPTWRMGRKITIDSATMMNKALEIIEARWLFGLSAPKIAVVIHPQSIVHSMVEFVDGSVVAQLSPPDMRLPIQYALTYPQRCPGPSCKMDWSKSQELQWEPVDLERFPAVQLGWEVAERGGTCGAVLNAANEAAVEMFLAGQIRFTDIVTASRQVLQHHQFESDPTLEQLVRLDDWARQEIRRWVTLSSSI
ncbi:MAG: 1-deoxy-D-xylulose-5-phosphate reductoisomerase [Pirellulaceae bacterium]|nr:1-deoxy-D-xylulose-5-phosphate reductoisomerase [Pirellulaceae bacterium]